jgi:hypothetical protein
MPEAISGRTQTKSCSGRQTPPVPTTAAPMPTSSLAMPGNLSRAKKWRRKKDLKRTLLAIGGKEVVWPLGDIPYLHELVAGGRLFYERVRLRRGDGGQPQRNAARLWGQCFGRFHLVTGFALGADGRWVHHGWLLGQQGRKGTAFLYETTDRRERYYGYVLKPHEAVGFWVGNFLWGCGQVPLKAFYGIETLDELHHVLELGRAAGRGRWGSADGAQSEVAPGARR